jgi:hypothetical protein
MYKRLLLRPLKDGDPAGAELLRASQLPVAYLFSRMLTLFLGTHEPYLHSPNERGQGAAFLRLF